MYAKKVDKKAILIPAAVALVLVLAVVIFLTQFTIVGSHLYSKKLESLDLRGQELSLQEYEKLARRLPDCHIDWDIPFQGSHYPSDSETLKVSFLTAEDVKILGYFHGLKTLDAMDCRDYDQILALKEKLPKLEVQYHFIIDGQDIAPEAKELVLGGISDDELLWVGYLKNLTSVTVGGSGRNIEKLRDHCSQQGIDFLVALGGEAVPVEETSLTVQNATQGDLGMLSLFQGLKKVHLVNPQAEPELVFELKTLYPDVDISWELEVHGKKLINNMVAADFSDVEMTSLEAVESALRYLPDVKNVFLGIQDGLNNDDVAAYRERNRDNYKVVWEIRLGKKVTRRTDITFFFPGRDWIPGELAFGDRTSYNLRYCEDLICVDVGHMGAVKHVDWLEGLVNLEYLILAHTDVRSLEGIQNCKKLKFLEIDWTPSSKDLSPLKELTALEDLNIGMTYPDVTPLYEMTWLKNLYFIAGSRRDAVKLEEALPNTNVVYSGTTTVGYGWRQLTNYYDMRDALGAPYMDEHSNIVKERVPYVPVEVE